MQNLHLVRDLPDITPIAETSVDPEGALRPTTFADYVGQRDIIEMLRMSVRAAKAGGWTLDHAIISGPPGLGKTTLAGVIARELGGRLIITSAPSISHKGELAALLTSLESGDVLFIDEIHRLAVPLQETLYSALEDFRLDLFTGKGARGGKAITVNLPRFTLIGATTNPGALAGPMLDRFGFHLQLQPYDVCDLTSIIERSAALLGVAIDTAGAAEIARRSRGIPRIANRLLRRVRDFALSASLDGALVVRRGLPAWITGRVATVATVATINAPLAAAALDAIGVDSAGLDVSDRAYLTALVSAGSPLGIEALCVAIRQPRQTIEDVVEPFLVQLGLVARTPRGRIATAAGVAHLGAP